MLTSSMLGNDSNEIDVALPEEQAEAQKLRETAAVQRKKRRRRISKVEPEKERIPYHTEPAPPPSPADPKPNTDSPSALAAEAYQWIRQRSAEMLEQTDTAVQPKPEEFVNPVEMITEPEPIATPTAVERHDPLERVQAAEQAQQQRKRQEEQRKLHMIEAAEQYRAETAAAKPIVKRQLRRAERVWQKTAKAVQAEQQQPKIDRRLAIVNSVCCLALVFGIAAAALMLERPTVSEIENRNLAAMPEFSVSNYLAGKYTAGISEWYDDTVPHRETFKHWTAKLRQMMGWHKTGATIHGDVPIVQETTTTAVTTIDPALSVTTTAATGTTTTTTTVPEDDGGELSNSILIHNKRGIMLYGGNETIGEGYAMSVNQFKAALGEQVQVYSMVVPTPCSFYTPEKFQYLVTSEEKAIDYIASRLDGVKHVDAYGALEQHADEPIFMRTDHHWSALGAFYAAETFSEVARVPFARMSSYTKVEKEGYVGTLYGYSGDITLKENPETFFYYVPSAQYTTTYYNRSMGGKHQRSLLLDLTNIKPVSWYLVYMGSDDLVCHVQTEVKNSRKLAIFKDSYGNALVPWLTSSFEEIYVIDVRYFEPNAITFLQERGVTDVLFAMNSFSASGANARKIDTIRTQ